MKEQIEKQAIKGMCENCVHNELCEVMLKLYRIVKVPPRMCKFYEDNAGYRKQSEGEWKSGKTINGEWGRSCSVCAAAFTGENAEWIAKEHDYCPRCGAKMKGGE